MPQVSAQATLANSIREPAGWYMLVFYGLGLVAGVARLFSAWLSQGSGDALLGLALTVLSIVGGYSHIRFMRNRRFELSDEAFHYEEDRRKLTVPWKDIRALKLEPKKKRLTIRVDRKSHTMLYFGLPQGEVERFQGYLLMKVTKHGIPEGGSR
jgi:hypothetical protein